MPLVQTPGSKKSLSSRNAPVSLRPEVENKLPVLDEQALLDESVAVNTFINNSAINSDNFHSSMDMVTGYTEGSIVYVTYYSQAAPTTDIQSRPADLQKTTLDDVHLNYAEIRNFELRCSSGSFEIQYSEEENITSVQGEALMFPGFVPKVGDIFLYKMRNSKVGVFHINSIQRLALGQETGHKVSFIMQEYLTTERRDQLKRRSSVWYFDKTKFFVGNHAMLSSEGYIHLKELKHLKAELIQNYYDRFYDHSMSSFMRPDKVYDPYIVEYWNRMVSVTECRFRPFQLFIAMRNYQKTIWSILHGNPIKSLKNLALDASKITYVEHFWGANMTALMGVEYLAIGDEADNGMSTGDGYGSYYGDNDSDCECCKVPRSRNTFHDAERNQFAKWFTQLKQKDYTKFQQYEPDPFFIEKAVVNQDIFKMCGCCDCDESMLSVELYGLSSAFYLGSPTMDAFEWAIYMLIHNKHVKPEVVIDLIKEYLDWSDDDAFYKHLFALYMIQKTVYWLEYHS